MLLSQPQTQSPSYGLNQAQNRRGKVKIRSKLTPYTPDAGEQNRFHQDWDKHFARLISAGTGSGKTRAGLEEALAWTFHHAPGSVGILCEPTYGMISRILIPEIEKALGCKIENSHYVADYQKSINKIVWNKSANHPPDAPNGIWWMISLSEPERVEGINADWIWIDEFRLVGGSGPIAKHKQKEAWASVVRRLRGSSEWAREQYKSGLWVTTTPDEPGSLLYRRFQDPKTKMESSEIYRWTIYENKHLPEHYVREVERTHVKGTGNYNRFVLGEFSSVAAGSFNFNSALHCFKDYPDPETFKEIIYGIDWGWSNPSAIIVVGIDGDDRAWVLDEYYKPKADIEKIVAIIIDMVDRWGDGKIYCDRAQPRHIRKLREYGLTARADTSKREEGIQELGSRLIFNKEGESKDAPIRARLYVHENCVNLISELQVYNEEVKEYDHAVDALRYAISNYRPRKAEFSVAFGKRPA